ncbi:MAG: hypothetical protein JXA78_11020 [Anaerolineales bacterium]|nr:hypothetical protein [Anaerolineales bacterium]
MMINKRRYEEQILQICLERVEAGESIQAVLADYPQQAVDLQAALDAAAWMRQQRLGFDPRPGFVGASRSRLAARLQEQKRRGGRRGLGWKWSPFGLAARLVLLLLLIVSAVSSGSNLARAARTWLPGDPLYPLKIAAERIELGLMPGATQGAQLHIRFAQRRLMEVQALAFEGYYEKLPPTIADFAYHVQNAIQDIGRLAQRDPKQARRLALEFQIVLSRQAGLVGILAGFAPTYSQADFERVLLVSQDGVLQIHDVLSPGSGQAQILALRATPGDYTRWARLDEVCPPA